MLKLCPTNIHLDENQLSQVEPPHTAQLLRQHERAPVGQLVDDDDGFDEIPMSQAAPPGRSDLTAATEQPTPTS